MYVGIHVAMNGLFSSVMATSVMESSLVELIGSNLTEGILILSGSCAKVATVALMDRVACTTRSSLLSQLSLCYSF